MSSNKEAATKVCIDAFGGLLQADSYGFYTALEFLGLYSGCRRTHGIGFPNVNEHSKVRPHLISHDYARRIAWRNEELPASRDLCFDTEMPAERFEAVESLLRTIAVPVPGRRKQSTWQNSHFYPYTDEAIHWDARSRGKKILIERIYYRGAGALAFRIVRADSNRERLSRTESELWMTLSGRKTVLSELMNLLKKHDSTQQTVEDTSPDSIEAISDSRHDVFEEQLCGSLANILSYTDEIPASSVVDALLYFIPFALVRLQFGRAWNMVQPADRGSYLGIVDCGTRPSQLRRESKRSLSGATSIIDDCLKRTAGELDSSKHSSTKHLKQFRTYFTRTAGAIGLLNAPVGIRHFTLSDALLEALVLAETSLRSERGSEPEVPFHRFCRVLHENWGLVVDHTAAGEAGLLNSIDGAVFEDNAEFLARKMRQLGFLHEYSDQTRIVRYGF